MKILITVPHGKVFERHFPSELLERLNRIGEVILNPYTRPFTQSELSERLRDIDIVMTHWGSVKYETELLDCAPKLKLLAHCAGTVANIASEECYNRNILVLSANKVMARYVAEGTLGYIIAGLRGYIGFDQYMRKGNWKRDSYDVYSLLDTKIGLIGLGTVGRNLLDLLKPFGCEVMIYDPYVSPEQLSRWDFARLAEFDEVMKCRLVTVHASQTPETYHIIDKKALSMIPDGGVLVNTSRGSLVDTEALICELESGRLRAVLDVYEHENCAQDERLLRCHNVLLQPHLAAAPAGSQMTAAIIDDIERYVRGEAMRLIVSHKQYIHMTQE